MGRVAWRFRRREEHLIYRGDCSGYVRAVGADVGVPMSGLANELVDFWNRDPGWIKLGHDALKASLMSGQGYLVVAGKKGKRHGHVVIVVPGESARHDAMGYWGNLSGVGEKDESLSKAWTRADLKGVEYFARPVPALAPKP